ncbi:LysM domain-containing protein [Weissella cibaria]|nr:LysM domain-containing protein [Weissella cibaria]
MTSTAPKSTATTGTYTVVDGDTLSSIAAANGVTVAALTAANPTLDLAMLSIGQVLVVPAAGASVTPVVVASSAAAEESTASAASSVATAASSADANDTTVNSAVATDDTTTAVASSDVTSTAATETTLASATPVQQAAVSDAVAQLTSVNASAAVDTTTTPVATSDATSADTDTMAVAPVQTATADTTAATQSVYDQFIAAGGTDALWNNIVLPESGGNPDAVSPNGYLGLGQTKNAWGTGSVETQTTGMLNYINDRYGSIDNAINFRAQNNWY